MEKPYKLNIREGRAYWMVDILWVILAEGKDTNNAFSLMWQVCRQGSGPGPHTHTQDEGFYVLDGQVTYLADGNEMVATAGDFIWIPRGTEHGFRVDSPTTTLLNCYTPAGFEQTIIEAGTPAGSFELPPAGLPNTLPMPAMMELMKRVGMDVLHKPDALRDANPFHQ